MLDAGKRTEQYFRHDPFRDLADCGNFSGGAWHLKSRAEYMKDSKKEEDAGKKYRHLDFESLEQMVETHQDHRAYKRDALAQRHSFLQFLCGVLQVNPDERWTPLQAAGSSFISGRPYDPKFFPVDDELVPSFMEKLDKVPNSSTTLIQRICADVPLPQQNPARSYRPSIDWFSDVKSNAIEVDSDQCLHNWRDIVSDDCRNPLDVPLRSSTRTPPSSNKVQTAILGSGKCSPKHHPNSI